MTEQFEKRPHLQGFTIVEVVAVLVVIAILALVVGSRVGGTDTARLSSRTGDIVSKLRYAHLRAIKSGTHGASAAMPRTSGSFTAQTLRMSRCASGFPVRMTRR
ncbi:prepilin-type N-terminal cleavage/methylation domain-containing protein [Salidesulfovibrio brasiliensis]|uniref:prepilin-type N-terminal cleavage/methylation domain-containing protein n=1 Tax=Salidesulfovibrio brasiliensis TaxID=221711 RepID=UPI000A679958|nr:prepilin-type N-terminal cleavage/methylation domain-containing protein [Salidesulfovibrio brasiliensis]